MEKLQSDEALTRVRIERLDEALDIPGLTLMKADVEGMECDVLDGAAGLISKHRPLLYLEANEPDAAALIEKVLGLDYKMYWHFPPMFNPDNHRNVTENLFPNIVSKNVFCVPQERNVTIQGAHQIEGPEDRPVNWNKQG